MPGGSAFHDSRVLSSPVCDFFIVFEGPFILPERESSLCSLVGWRPACQGSLPWYCVVQAEAPTWSMLRCHSLCQLMLLVDLKSHWQSLFCNFCDSAFQLTATAGLLSSPDFSAQRSSDMEGPSVLSHPIQAHCCKQVFFLTHLPDGHLHIGDLRCEELGTFSGSCSSWE